MCSAATPRTLTRTYRCRQRGLYAATPRATSTSVDSTEAAKIFTSDGEVVPRRLVTLPNSGAEATSPNVWPMARFLWLSWTGLTHLVPVISREREQLLRYLTPLFHPDLFPRSCVQLVGATLDEPEPEYRGLSAAGGKPLPADTRSDG